MAPIATVGTLAGPISAGYIYDVTGSYQVAFMISIAVFFLAAVTFVFAKRPKPPATSENLQPGI